MGNKYAILRVERLKSVSKISSAAGHNLRLDNVPNADQSLSHQNKLLYGEPDVVKAHKELIAELDIKVRSNGCRALEYMMTFSPEMKGKIDIDEWAKDSVEFLKKRHGKGLHQVVLHLDETTPHLQAIVTPVYEKQFKKKKCWKISAEHFGGRSAFVKMQSDYARAVKRHGLERGVMNSRAKHRDLQSFYGHVENALTVAKEAASDLTSEVIDFKKHWNPFTRNKALTKMADAIQNHSESIASLGLIVETTQQKEAEYRKTAEQAQNERDEALKRESDMKQRYEQDGPHRAQYELELANQKIRTLDNELSIANDMTEHLNKHLDKSKQENEMLRQTLRKRGRSNEVGISK